jgi:hypothetical protein
MHDNNGCVYLTCIAIFGSAESAIKIHTSAMPAWNTSMLSMHVFIWYLNDSGAMYARYGCVYLPICQIRRRRICTESDVAIDRRIHVVHTWPHHHLIPNNNMNGRS